jgi:hypothetical protein
MARTIACMGFHDKDLRTLPAITVAHRQLKCYRIDQVARPFEPEVISAAYAALPGLVAAVDSDTAGGWVVLHRGSDTGAYLNVYSWVWDNAVELHCAVAGQPAADCPDTDPTNFVPLTKAWIGCVWELAVLEHERSSWIRHVLSPEVPDIAAYTADTLPDGPVGR